jgi:hypothetical protein
LTVWELKSNQFWIENETTEGEPTGVAMGYRFWGAHWLTLLRLGGGGVAREWRCATVLDLLEGDRW